MHPDDAAPRLVRRLGAAALMAGAGLLLLQGPVQADPLLSAASLCALSGPLFGPSPDSCRLPGARPVDLVPGGRALRLETGIVSFYAHKFEGRRTASGARYDGRELTAAHLTLPFGTLVRVTNLRNNRSVVVRINDRGPHVRGRVLDLSREAARLLGMIPHGIVKAVVQVLGTGPGPGDVRTATSAGGAGAALGTPAVR